jgi:hypothetical protein
LRTVSAKHVDSVEQKEDDLMKRFGLLSIVFDDHKHRKGDFVRTGKVGCM